MVSLRRWSLLRNRLILTAVVSALWTGEASAQIFAPGGRPIRSSLPDESPESVFLPAQRNVVRCLAKARGLLAQQRYGEGVRYLGTILDGPEDYFFQDDRKSERAVHRSLKGEALRLIGSMPRKGRELHELQYGSRARKMLDEAVLAGDSEGLAEVSRRFFHTQAGYEATLLLGLNHLDRARPLAAALALRRLRQSAADVAWLEPGLSLALAICWREANLPRKSVAVLTSLKERYGSNTIDVAGRRVRLFDKPSEAPAWLAALAGPRRVVRPPEADRWPMFGGNASRSAASSGGDPLLNVRWRVPAANDPAHEDHVRQLQRSCRELDVPPMTALHPLAVDGVVLMRTVRSLMAVDFVTGRRLWEDPVDEPINSVVVKDRSRSAADQARRLGYNLSSRLLDDAVYGTLSSDGRCVFSVEDLSMGITRKSWRMRTSTPRKLHNRLAAHDIHTGKLKWHIGGPAGRAELDQAGTFFLGPPLPLAGRLYALAEVKEEIRLMVLDAASGRLLWSQQLAMVERDIVMDPLRRSAGASPSYADGVLICRRPTARSWPSTRPPDRCCGDSRTAGSTAARPWCCRWLLGTAENRVPVGPAPRRPSSTGESS